MFLKPYKVKSNATMKVQERTAFRGRVGQCFGLLMPEDLSTLIPPKCIITTSKLITHSAMQINLYCVNKLPMFFETEDRMLIPTVYALWVVPHMVPYFTTHPGVLPKLSNGADLMLPGVVPQATGMNMYGRYAKDTVVGVNLTTSRAAAAVGQLIRSSDDLYMCGGRGSAVKILHTFGDKLWSHEPSMTQQIPDMCTAPLTDDDFPALGSSRSPTKSKKVPEQKKEDKSPEALDESGLSNILNRTYLTDDTNGVDKPMSSGIQQTHENPQQNVTIENPTTDSTESEADITLKKAFLTAIKHPSKSLVLPILTSTFFRNHILAEAATPIDLKKTKYKKLSNFLSRMAAEGFIVVHEETKGVDKITSINYDHPDLISFIADAKSAEENHENEQALFHSEMTELYIVTDQVASFFARLNYKRGEGIPSVQIKKELREYISKNNLTWVDPPSKCIKLDECLQEICQRPVAELDDIFNIILSKMKHTYEMRSIKDAMKNKPQIQMSIVTRSGNKKVTLISNVDCYGIIMPEFVKACKQGAAASTNIVKLPSQSKELVQIQGNQVRFIYNLLTEKYKIPAKQILGLDLAKPEKKKK